MNSSEAAEEIVKLSLEGFEVAARITGSGAKNVAMMLYAMSKDKKKSKGKTTLNNMLKSGSPLKIFSLKQDELSKFNGEAKTYGVLYTALINKKHPDPNGIVDIMVREEDAPKVNRIFEKLELSSVDTATIKSEIEADKMEEMIEDAKDRGVEVLSDEEKLANDILSKPIQKEENEMSNPNLAKTEKSPLSEHSSENTNKEGVVSNKKPSVREKIREIKEELKIREQDKTEKEKSMPEKVITNVVKSKKSDKTR